MVEVNQPPCDHGTRSWINDQLLRPRFCWSKIYLVRNSFQHVEFSNTDFFRSRRFSTKRIGALTGSVILNPGLNNLPQSLHSYGFSPVWIRRCLTKLVFWENLFPHSSHLNGCSPVWVRKWTTKHLLLAKPFPQSSHLNGFSPVWTRRCLIKLLIALN